MKAVTFPKTKRLFLIAGIVIFLAIALLPSAYFYSKFSNLQEMLADPEKIKTTEVQKTITAVGKLMVLPETETPTVATVSDEEKLREQPFFANAKKGDRVLIYLNAKKAILYDPILNKIVEVAPINLATGSASPVPSKTEDKYSLILYNGTEIVGLTKKYEEKLKVLTQILEVTVLDRDNAAKKDYEKSLLIDLKGNSPQAQKFADLLNLTVSELPVGETATSEADFLIILGRDQQ